MKYTVAGSALLAVQASFVFIDTEGFYSTGKSDAYDDRIFALSTLISSVLVYNLPETVRESDVEKLSFSVELADALFSSSQARRPACPASPRCCGLTSTLSRQEGRCTQCLCLARPSLCMPVLQADVLPHQLCCWRNPSRGASKLGHS